MRSVIWSSRFRVAHRLASRFRDGAVFLVGDAAHVHSPAGGQGMNLGIQDAAVLGELLADAVSGARGGDALDAYERERRAVARRVIALIDRMTRMATLRHPAQRIVRNAAMGVVLARKGVRRALATRIAQLDR